METCHKFLVLSARLLFALPGAGHLPVGWFIIIPDQTKHYSVVCKFDDVVSVVNVGAAVMGELVIS